MNKKVIAPVRGDKLMHKKLNKGIITQLRVIKLPWPKIFLAVALIATTGGALFATRTIANIDKNIATAKEEARAANVKLTKITTPNCIDCFSIEDAVSQLKKQNVEIKQEKAVTIDSKEGKALIKQFAISRLPTYILTGEITKKTIEGFIKNNGEVKEKTFVFTKVIPLFVDAKTKNEIGKVTATILTDPTCPQCADPKLTIETYKKAGIKIVEEKEVTWNSPEGQALINQYKITKLPTFILSSDIGFYDSLKSNWSRIGTVESDKTYIARNLFLPYRDTEKGLLGLVDLIYLTDATCTDCYNAEQVQKPILTRSFGVGLASERTVDISSAEGRELVSQYKITKVPTIILSPNVDQYANLKNVWPSVGTVEANGWYIFREMRQLGGIVYKDLTTNQIVGKTQANTAGKAGQ